MAQMFWVQCPSCDGRFYCHEELWDSGYDLLCPFCSTTFSQQEGLESMKKPKQPAPPGPHR